MTKITVFTQTGCYPCIVLKHWLKQENIDFIERNITEDEKALKEFKELNLEFTPVSYIEHKGVVHQVLGVSQKKFSKILSS
ncbi:glutaredoxin family protein [Bacillus mexicanus]|uniref:glutaredoxin family protein n=1 Tax=Bacillus mexicanus TaxID=2834415 RepID=UPI003D228E48